MFRKFGAEVRPGEETVISSPQSLKAGIAEKIDGIG